MRSLTHLLSLLWSRLAQSDSRRGPSPLNAFSKKESAGNSSPRSVLALALLTALAPYGLAQRTTPAAPPAKPTPPHFNSPAGSFALSRGSHSSSRFHRPSPSTSLLFPFFDDSFDPDEISSTGDPNAASQPQPPAFLLQAARALSGSTGYAAQPDNNREPSSSQPLMIELQGDRYVRISSAAIDGEALPLPSKSTGSHFAKPHIPSSATTPAPIVATASSVRDLPSVVLVFRDGHSEEVHDYTIADQFLYARGDYYTDGYWNKKIDLSSLDLSETMQANSTRNVKFVLPSSPNEVITRP